MLFVRSYSDESDDFSNTNTVVRAGAFPKPRVCCVDRDESDAPRVCCVDRDESDAILKTLLLYQEEYNKIEKKEKVVTFVT